MLMREGKITQMQISQACYQAQNVYLRAQSRVVAMARAEAEHQKKNHQLVVEGSLVADARKKLTAQSNKLLRQAVVRKNRKVTPSEMRQLSTYAPLEVELEKKRILDSYSNL